MSDTPRTDALRAATRNDGLGYERLLAHARQLERELMQSEKEERNAAPREARLPGGDGVSRVSRTTANPSVGTQTAPEVAAPFSSDKYDYAALCRSLAAWLLGQSQGSHRELKRGETADRLLEVAAILTSAKPAALPVSTLEVLRRAERAVAAYGHAEYVRQDIAALIDAHLTWSEIATHIDSAEKQSTNQSLGDKRDYAALLSEFETLVLDANDEQLPRRAQLPISKRLNEVRALLQVRLTPSHAAAVEPCSCPETTGGPFGSPGPMCIRPSSPPSGCRKVAEDMAEDMATHAHNLEIAYGQALDEIRRLREYEWMYKDLCK